MTDLFRSGSFSGFMTTMEQKIPSDKRDVDQLHMMWTIAGLLMVQPSPSDFLYFDSAVKRNDRQQDRTVSRVNGSYIWTKTFSYEEMEDIIKRSYEELLKDLITYERYRSTFSSMQSARNVEQYVMVRLQREMRFLMVGIIAAGFEMPVDLFQYLVVAPTPDNLMFRGGIDKTLADWYNVALVEKKILNVEKFLNAYNGEQIAAFKSVSYYGGYWVRIRVDVMFKSKSVNVRGGGQSGAITRENESSKRLISESSTLRRIHFNRNLTINEQTEAGMEVDANDSRDTMRKIAEAGATLVRGTSIVGSLSSTPLTKVKVNETSGASSWAEGDN